MKSSSKRFAVWATVFAGLVFLFSATANAANVAFFDNGTYTDTSAGGESARLTASLVSLGHTVNSFSGIAAADWEAATQANDLLVIPELESGNLFSALDAAAIDAISDYVTGGGGLIMFDSPSNTQAMLNGIFGYSLSGNSGGSTTLNVAAAAGTAFEGGPVTLPSSNAVRSMSTASLPAGTLDLYNGSGFTSVFLVPEGNGFIAYLAFDWFEDPTPLEWEEVLGSAVTAVQDSSATGTARFKVTKTFSDGSTDEVDVMLSCNSGLPLEQSFTIAGGDPDGVTFVVTDIPEGGADCEVTESGGPGGYTTLLNGGEGCSWVDVTSGLRTCEITNNADPASYTVTKDWEIFNDGGDLSFSDEVSVTITCTNYILPLENESKTKTVILGDGDSATVEVDTTDGSATCSAEEVFTQSGVEDASEGCGETTLDAGGSHSCAFTNTVFFEGIPTLSQYGMAILVLLTLGLGLVGVRRFV